MDDNAIEVANELSKKFENVHVVYNNVAKGVKYAVAGVSKAKFENILITAVDEIFPILSINKMLNMIIDENYDFVSGTRYSKGGMRLGGSFIGSIFSITANRIFKLITKIPFSDCTTGIKMMRKNVWNSIDLQTNQLVGHIHLSYQLKFI